MAMVRKQVYLPAALDRTLKAAAKKQGVSEAAIIRERLAHRCSQDDGTIDAAARKQFIAMLRRVRREAMKHPGTGWKFNRDEAYEERLERQMPR
jgi:hypothetical protein